MSEVSRQKSPSWMCPRTPYKFRRCNFCSKWNIWKVHFSADCFIAQNTKKNSSTCSQQWTNLYFSGFVSLQCSEMCLSLGLSYVEHPVYTSMVIERTRMAGRSFSCATPSATFLPLISFRHLVSIEHAHAAIPSATRALHSGRVRAFGSAQHFGGTRFVL